MKNLYLFTQQFPYKGGEPFLETEIHYLSKAFDKVIIFPLTGHGSEKLSMPLNVEVIDFEVNRPVFLKKLLLKHGWIIAKWFFLEFIKSPHRFKYITQFNWNFNRIAGLLNNAIELNFVLAEINKTKTSQPIYYSYWFNDWVSVLTFIKELGFKMDINTRVHLYDFEEEFNSRKYLPFRFIELSKIHKIYPISEYAKKYLKKSFNTNGVLSRLGVKNIGLNNIDNLKTYFTIVTCSSLSWYKRPFLLVDLMCKFGIKINWLHFGDGAMEDEFLKKTKLLPPNINFTYSGRVSNTEILNFYGTNSVDLLINVSSFEGIPVSLMEAISFGIPVVGCNVCGMPEIVNQQTGILLDVHFDPSEAAIQIKEFLELNSRNVNFRKGIKEFWKDNFDAEKNYRDFITELNQ